MIPTVHSSIICRIVSCHVFFLCQTRSTTDNGEEERKLLQCLRKSVISPYKKQVISLPSSSVAEPATSSPARKTEMRTFASPRNKGLSLKQKPSPRRGSASKTWTSPRRCTPHKHVVAKTRTSTPLRKSKQFRVDDRKKTYRRTPNKTRSHTPCKSAKRTPAKGMLTDHNLVYVICTLRCCASMAYVVALLSVHHLYVTSQND